MEANQKAVVVAPPAPLEMPDYLAPEQMPLVVLSDGESDSGVAPVKQGRYQMVPVTRPSWMDDTTDASVREQVDAFMRALRENPADIALQAGAQKLGQQGANAMLHPVGLFQKKVDQVMKERTEGGGSPVSGTLLQVKQALDQVNPAVVATQPISVKVAIFFSRTHLPKANEVLDLIYARRETVQSLVRGLEADLATLGDELMRNYTDLISIYRDLIVGHRLTERDVYFAQHLQNEAVQFLNGLTDAIEVANVEEFVATLMSAMLNLQTEVQANLQFFAGAQAMSKLTREQITQLTSLARLLKNAVLANLGLAVTAQELASSAQVTGMLREAIGNTIADTGKKIRETGEVINKARSEAGINLEALQRGCAELELFYENQAIANREIIELGVKTSGALSDLSTRLNRRVEGGHASMISQGATQ